MQWLERRKEKTAKREESDKQGIVIEARATGVEQ